MKWVLKLGGAQHADARLASLVRHVATFDPPPIIAPGGGPFADQVRRAQKRWLFDDATAHKMAVLAVRQYGLLLAALGELPTSEAAPKPPCVWLPDADAAYGRADWTLTSDSLAARLACEVGAERLVLVKPVCDRPPAELVDEQFMAVAKEGGLRVTVLDAAACLRLRGVDEFEDAAV